MNESRYNEYLLGYRVAGHGRLRRAYTYKVCCVGAGGTLGTN